VTAYLDANIVIYFVERNPTWLPKVVSRFARFRMNQDRLAVGDLTLAECLVGPFLSGDAAVEASYRMFFADPDIQVLSLTKAICEQAAALRAVHKFELVDALHLATAIEHGCGLFLTNDVNLSRCTAIPVEILT